MGLQEAGCLAELHNEWLIPTQHAHCGADLVTQGWEQQEVGGQERLEPLA